MLTLLLLLSSAQATDLWFYPGTGPETVSLAPDSTLGGVPLRRTGALLARVEDPAILLNLPEVARVERLGGDGHVVRVTPRPGIDEVALSRTLWERPDVAWSHPDFRFRAVPLGMPNDPYVGDQWHLENTGQWGGLPNADINAETAWALSTGAGGLISVIDTGVDLSHPDLRVTSGWDYIDDDDDSSPDYDYDGGPHGTSAAGLAAAVGNNGLGVAGVAYDADLYAIRFIGGETDLTDLYESFVESVDAGAWVLSNSWGFGDSCKAFPTFASIQDAMDYAEQNGRDGLGAAVVVAAGNGNCDCSQDGLQLPETVFSVAATNGNDDREGYSSFGDVVDAAAPSGGVLTTDLTGDSGYGSFNGDVDYNPYFSGTSAATPIVAGTFALMFAANPRLSADQAREVLRETATKVNLEEGTYDDSGWSPYYGFGRIDAGAAVTAVADTAAPSVPTLIGPEGEARVDTVVLRWQPASDPDGDWISYKIFWWTGSDEASAHVEFASGTSLDITEQVEVDDEVTWHVKAMDPWGAGEASGNLSFVVDDVPAVLVEKGCATGGRGGVWGILAGLGLILVRGRSGRRR